MARSAFYSFHYKPDNGRVSQLRDMGVVEGNPAASHKEWDAITREGNKKIQKWIDDTMEGKSVVIVLIGADTAGRKWIGYEIEKAWGEGKGLLGIHIHNLKDEDGKQSAKGANPFDSFILDGKKLSSVVKTYSPPAHSSKVVHNIIKENLASWVEHAIEIRRNFRSNPRNNPRNNL